MQGRTRLKLLLHGAVLLLIAAVPFFVGAYRNGAALLALLLVVWPLACFFSPFALARTSVKWYFALPLVPVFFILPMCVLLTPAGLAYLGGYPILYTILAAVGAALGAWRYRKRQARMRSGGVSL